MELALPLCALKQQECEIEIKLSEKKDCLYKSYSTTNTTTRSSDNTTFTVTVSNNAFDINTAPRPTLLNLHLYFNGVIRIYLIILRRDIRLNYPK